MSFGFLSSQPEPTRSACIFRARSILKSEFRKADRLRARAGLLPTLKLKSRGSNDPKGNAQGARCICPQRPNKRLALHSAFALLDLKPEHDTSYTISGAFEFSSKRPWFALDKREMGKAAQFC